MENLKLNTPYSIIVEGHPDKLRLAEKRESGYWYFLDCTHPAQNEIIHELKIIFIGGYDLVKK